MYFGVKGLARVLRVEGRTAQQQTSDHKLRVASHWSRKQFTMRTPNITESMATCLVNNPVFVASACHDTPEVLSREFDMHSLRVHELVETNPLLASLAPDVEALLVRDVKRQNCFECYIVPIDACYELVGRIRRRWKGFDGGEEAWKEIDSFVGTK